MNRTVFFQGGFRLGVGGSRDQGAKAAAVLGDGPFGGFTQVVPEVPPVRDLDGLRGAGGGAFSEERRPIPADDLDTWPFGEPGRQSGCFPVGQQVNGAAGLDVDEDGAVVAAFAGGVFVDADHTRDGHLGLGKSVDQPEHGTAADGHSENAGYTGSGPAREGQTDRGQGRAQPLGPLPVPACHARYLLDEVRRAHPEFPQANRRTLNWRTPLRPPLGTSAGNRR